MVGSPSHWDGLEIFRFYLRGIVHFGAFLHIIFEFRDLALGHTTNSNLIQLVSAEGELHRFLFCGLKYVYKLYSVSRKKRPKCFFKYLL